MSAASPAVVADSACPRHAIDIEAFATCEGDRVAAPEPETIVDSQMAVDSESSHLAPGTDFKATDGGVEQPNSVSVARADRGRP